MRMRRKVAGYLDMGKITIPSLPQGIAFTDRDDGTVWLLTHDTDAESPDDAGHIAINDTIPRHMNYRLYSAYDGPVFGAVPQLLRLLVRGGRLGYEPVDFGFATTDIDRAPIMTRNNEDRRHFGEIIVPTTWLRPDDVLGWQEVDQS